MRSCKYHIVQGKRPWAPGEKLRVGGCTEEVLEWFNYPHVGPHPSYEVRYRINLDHLLLVLCRSQPDSGESCIVLEGGLTRSLTAKLPQHLSLTAQRVLKDAANKAMRVQNFAARCRGTWSPSAWLQLCIWAQLTYFRFTMQEFSIVGGYTDNL